MRQDEIKKGGGKRKSGIWILAGVLAVLLVIYFGLQAWNKSQEEKKSEKEKAEEIHVTDTAAEDIVSMEFDVGNGEMKFVRESDTWYCAEDKDFPLAQSYPENIAETLGNITADRKLENGDSLEDYGLEEPVYRASYTEADGSVTEIRFGNTAGEQYYVTAGDESVVYTVNSSVIEPMQYSLEDMAQLDAYPSIGSGNLVKEEIIQNGQTTVYDSEDEGQEEDIAAVAGGLGAVTLSEAADYSAEEKDLPGFGLDEQSRITVKATYTDNGEEKVLTLYIGGKDEDGNRYVMINDSKIVYLISEEICNNILNT